MPRWSGAMLKRDIHLTPEQLGIVLGILEEFVPNHEVWAFGSRVQSPDRLKKYSDLDIAVLSEKPLPMDTLAAIKDAFSESDLPWRVDVIDWAATADSFRKIIEQEYVVLKPTRSV